MTPPGGSDVSKKGARGLWWSFIVIVAAFVLGNIVSIYEMRKSQMQVRLISRHAATNIELVARLSRDLDQQRFLVDHHIFEKQTIDMIRIESKLADVHSDIAAAVRSYESIDDGDDERAVWQELVAEITAIEPGIADVVSASRGNRDADAQAQLDVIDARFQAINRSANRLLDLNRRRANQEVSQVRALQLRAVTFLAVLTVVWTAFALLTARRAIRLITQRELQKNHAMALLEERNRELDAFAGRVAHDLRGPLTAISLATSARAKTAALEERNKAILRRGVARMEGMIQDLLTLSRISAQVAGATCQTTRVAALAQEDLTPIVEGASGVLIIDAAPAMVPCTEGLLRQVLWNLGENAVKYQRSAVGLLVEIHGRIIPNAYEFTISDNGNGMSSLEISHACEPFFRGKDAQSSSGSGLGLSIVKRVIEASGGSMSIDSIPGRGTTVRIRLPLAASQRAA